ncbi:MAG TPA: hypothetical protein PK385_09260 [Spirochaetota bacterium]|nr:hypothetical protein [Spirochaetota bacterium]HOS33822.1 hypothetical protein [Spirochaetota bacterium]HOS56232.1 hypothetical protein [Spirochaetota bacterium]HPK62103.1 hypothetical protein [Spirochaetota bacterium]HQF78639.1 hypothetical protein [Spirochaetota bacterium]
MTRNETTGGVVKFIEKGELDSDSVVIFSSFFPFNNNAPAEFFSFLDDNIYKKVFTEFIRPKNGKKEFTFDALINAYVEYISTLEKKRIHIVAFGVFSNVFINIANLLKGKINSLTLIEPDFANSILMKIFDSKEVHFFKFSSLKNQYIQDSKQNYKRYLSKTPLSLMKYYYYSLKEYLPESMILKQIVDLDVEILILWKLMEKELWPLPQILTDDYEISAFSLSESAIDALIGKNPDITDQIRSHIEKNIILENY